MKYPLPRYVKPEKKLDKWAIRLADCILRNFAGMRIIPVQQNINADPEYREKCIRYAKQHLGEDMHPVCDFWTFLKANEMFLLQSRAMGVQIGVTDGFKAVLEDRFGGGRSQSSFESIRSMKLTVRQNISRITLRKA